MAFGKILGFAALGVAAIAAAPFTGGGSIAGATALAGSLAGAEALAVGAAVAGGAYGASQAKKEREEEERNRKVEIENRKTHKEKDDKISELNIKAEKYEKAFIEAIERFEGDKEYFNYIIASMAMGMSIAISNGEIHDNEIEELEEFVGGIANSNYPQRIKDEIDKLYHRPPNFSTAIKYLEKVNPSNFDNIADMLEIVMEADGIHHKEQLAFIEAFNQSKGEIKYIPEKNDTQNEILLEIKEKISA